MYDCSDRKNAKAYKYKKVLGCISMRAKLGIVYICITIIIATFPVHNCDKKSLHIAIHLHPSYFLSFHINKFAHYFASNKSHL